MPLTYGIEIEVILPAGVTHHNAAVAIDAAGVPCYAAGYSHAVERTKWKVVSDGSLSSAGIIGGQGAEFVSPILTDETLEDQVNKVCATLASLGARVNRSCGLHVHIGARHLALPAMKKLAELYAENEDVIDGLLPPSRRGNANHYLQPVKNLNRANLARATDVAGIANSINSQRYVKLNFQSYWRQGTVEFRQHSGTIDPVKILRWVSLCAKLIGAAEREQTTPVALPAGTPPEFSSYWRSGRRTRILFEMLTRAEGVTSEELRVRLGVTSRPNIRWHYERAGEAIPRTGQPRRDGFEIFKLTAPTAARTVPTAPATLDNFMAKLEMTAEEQLFWQERVAMVQPETGTAAIPSNTMRRAAARGGA